MSSSLPVSQNTRRFLKLTSLGLAGLIAGLLSGCTSAAANPASATWQPTPGMDLPASLDARQTPATHHLPSARRLEYGIVRPVYQASASRHP